MSLRPAAGRLRLVVITCVTCAILAAGGAVAVAQPASPAGDDLARARADLERLDTARRFAEAIPAAERVVDLTRRRFGEETAEFATAVAKLGALLRTQGRYAEAEPLVRRAIAIREKVLGPIHVDVGNLYGGLGALARLTGRMAEAEGHYKTSIAILEKAAGARSGEVAVSLLSLANHYVQQGRTSEAERHFQRALDIREALHGPDSPLVANTLASLAVLYQNVGRRREAEAFERRALAIQEKAEGRDAPVVALTLERLAGLLSLDGRNAEARGLIVRAEGIVGRRAAETVQHGRVITMRALIDARDNKVDAAVATYRRAIAILERHAAVEPDALATALNNLAGLLANSGRGREAEPLHLRQLEMRLAREGPDHRTVTNVHGNLGYMYFQLSDWEKAARHTREAAAGVVRRARRGIEAPNDSLSGEAKAESERETDRFRYLVKSLDRLPGNDGAQRAALLEETFTAAQWAVSSAAAGALSRMAARQGQGDPQLAAVVRERQDLAADWQALDRKMAEARARPPAQRRADEERALLDGLAAIDAKVAALDARIRGAFPDYGQMVRPEPLSLAATQALLRADEALLVYLGTPAVRPAGDETFLWVVTRTTARWLRLAAGPAAIAHDFAALRCGLDRASWKGDGGAICEQRVNRRATVADVRNGKPLPFDMRRAHAAYTVLFAPVADDIRGKRLIVVADGPLSQIPLQTLVMEPASEGDYGRARWLGRAHAVTILPTVASLAALRRVAKPSAADRAMVGFGNPVLDGAPSTSAERLAARAAAYRQDCTLPLDESETLLRAAADLGTFAALGAGAAVTAAAVRRLDPVPKTAWLLCDLAEEMAAAGATVHLGRSATERRVRDMSASGELARYRVVHFATHGLLPGQLAGSAEPGLVLTPADGDGGDESENGYLTASEIADLRLDAEAVILSACNTAAGGDRDGQALAGLAQAFLYAQARAVVVSHWEVYEDAAVDLVTGLLTRAAEGGAGLAETQRATLAALIETGGARKAHPAYWAPFVVVGEGAGRAK